MTINLKDSPQAVILLLVFGIFLFVGTLMLNEIGNTEITDRTLVNNSPDGHINVTACDTDFDLAHQPTNEAFYVDGNADSDDQTFNDSVIVSNVTNIFLNSVRIGNWTLNPATAQIRFHDGDVLNCTNFAEGGILYNVSYTWQEGNRARNSIILSMGALTNISVFQGTFGVVIAASILIGVVFLMLVFSERRKGKGQNRGQL